MHFRLKISISFEGRVRFLISSPWSLMLNYSAIDFQSFKKLVGVPTEPFRSVRDKIDRDERRRTTRALYSARFRESPFNSQSGSPKVK